MQSFPPERVPELDVGDRVVAVHHLGGYFRRPVPRGTTGVVVDRTADGSLGLAFATGHTLRVDPNDVALPDPRDDLAAEQ
ncbi:MAG: hypothetical protein DLM57_14445 [Pseudonocardiales bacterium]|nr:MAG: hypothetical protein DLM57_14445 [Pseudonocardiales bacterium]